MDKVQSEITKTKRNVADNGLPAVVASLKLLTVNTNLPPTEKKRVLRKRIPTDNTNENLNRRCSLRPRKRTCSEMEDDSSTKKGEDEINVTDYYLNRNLKRRLNNLETIFEENDISECTTYMSAKRYRRMIQFQQKPSDSKLKKRRAKIKKVFGSKINFKRKCTSMQMLLDKLNGIRAESPAKVSNEVQ